MNINKTYTSFVSNTPNQKTIQDNKTSTKVKDQTVIQSTNTWESESDRRMKILDEKYQKINEQNKQFENPKRHIVEKYKDSYSPYFRSDLTKGEREAAYTMEMCWAGNDKGGQYDSRDAAFRKENPIYFGVEEKERKAFNRQTINEQLHGLFTKNGIAIPNKTSLTFTINPNDFKLEISGSKDESLINQLEYLLNTDKNTRELFFHIMKSSSDDSSQFTPEKMDKFHLVNQIKTITGYNLKDLENINGKFVTENGTNIFDIYKDALLKNPYTAKNAGIAASHYGSHLYELAKNGFDSIPDLVLSIAYENGSLQDIGQKETYGTGKTDWIAEWKGNFSS